MSGQRLGMHNMDSAYVVSGSPWRGAVNINVITYGYSKTDHRKTFVVIEMHTINPDRLATRKISLNRLLALINPTDFFDYELALLEQQSTVKQPSWTFGTFAPPSERCKPEATKVSGAIAIWRVAEIVDSTHSWSAESKYYLNHFRLLSQRSYNPVGICVFSRLVYHW